MDTIKLSATVRRTSATKIDKLITISDVLPVNAGRGNEIARWTNNLIFVSVYLQSDSTVIFGKRVNRCHTLSRDV